MTPLVTGDWLAAHGAEVHIVDVRWYPDGRPGRDAYLAGHIPGAVYLDLDTELSAPASTADGRHPLPSPEQFAAALGRAGIASGAPVVGYDDAGGSIAARLWWLLHVLDEPVAVLDGGLAAWPGELTTEVPAPAPAERAPREWPARRFRSADEVATSGEVVYDARATERFAGAPSPLDPRPGHVPGAVSRAWADNLGPDRRFRPAAQLRERYADAADRGAVAYCGSGVTACHDLLALEVAGITDTALYPGSWSQWAADSSRPTELSGPPRVIGRRTADNSS